MARKTAKDSAAAEKAKTRPEQAMPEATPQKVADLSIGDIALIPGFDGLRRIRGAAKVTDGADAGKLDVALGDKAGEVEYARFGPAIAPWQLDQRAKANDARERRCSHLCRAT